MSDVVSILPDRRSADIRAAASSVAMTDTVDCRLADGREVLGECAAIDRDQAGVRLTLCPVDTSRSPHRVCIPRLPTGWREPHLERWDEPTDEWRRVGTVVEIGI